MVLSGQTVEIQMDFWRKKKHYLVKWTDGSTPSWQPTENVSPALKEAFHRTRTQSNTRRKRLGRIFRN